MEREYGEKAYERAKIGGNDELTVSDAVLILRYIVGLEEFGGGKKKK